jgi:hypothetical protein
MKKKKVLKNTVENFVPKLIRMAKEDWAIVKARADKYNGGNISGFVRYAALNFVPSERDQKEI